MCERNTIGLRPPKGRILTPTQLWEHKETLTKRLVNSLRAIITRMSNGSTKTDTRVMEKFPKCARQSRS